MGPTKRGPLNVSEKGASEKDDFKSRIVQLSNSHIPPNFSDLLSASFLKRGFNIGLSPDSSPDPINTYLSTSLF